MRDTAVETIATAIIAGAGDTMASAVITTTAIMATVMQTGTAMDGIMATDIADATAIATTAIAVTARNFAICGGGCRQAPPSAH
jgi:hypothetical protein